MINGKKIAALLFIVIVFLGSCKKDKDVISTETIHGQVYNFCTDSGMANIKVYLSTSGQAISASSLSAISDANGNFSFVNAQIHSSSDYDYTFYIPSASGIGGTTAGFDGGEWDLDKSKLNISYILGVVPHFKIWNVYFPSNIHITSNDTFTVTLQQNIFHKNVPDNNNYQLIIPFPPPPLPQYPSNWISATDNYWMGLWHVTLDKVENGVHIIQKDSFYVGYGATVTDTIPWQ